MNNLKREDIEKIYEDFCEKNEITINDKVVGLNDSLRKAFDEYINEIILDAFYEGYICGIASKS